MWQGVAYGSGKLYLCFWVMKLVAVYKQIPDLVWIAHRFPAPIVFRASCVKTSNMLRFHAVFFAESRLTYHL